MDTCRYVRCPNMPHLKGLCKRHYDEQRTAGRQCSLEDCARSQYARGLCRSHYRDKPCSVNGCESKAKTAGLCQRHGRLLERYGSTDARVCEIKQCANEIYSGTDSPYCAQHTRRRRLVEYGEQNCEKCRQPFMPHSSTQRWCYTCVPKNDKSAHARMTRYNVSNPEYDAMLARQGRQCAICGKVMIRPCVDHDHKTGEVRGLLCGRCNTVLHEIEDNDWMDKARAYLGREHIEA